MLGEVNRAHQASSTGRRAVLCQRALPLGWSVQSLEGQQIRQQEIRHPRQSFLEEVLAAQGQPWQQS